MNIDYREHSEFRIRPKSRRVHNKKCKEWLTETTAFLGTPFPLSKWLWERRSQAFPLETIPASNTGFSWSDYWMMSHKFYQLQLAIQTPQLWTLSYPRWQKFYWPHAFLSIPQRVTRYILVILVILTLYWLYCVSYCQLDAFCHHFNKAFMYVCMYVVASHICEITRNFEKF